MISRRGLMLREAVTAHKRQRAYVRAHPEYEPDYRFGLRLARAYFGTRLARSAWIALRRGELGRGTRDVAILVRYDPRGAPGYAWRAGRHAGRKLLGRALGPLRS